MYMKLYFSLCLFLFVYNHSMKVCVVFLLTYKCNSVYGHSVDRSTCIYVKVFVNICKVISAPWCICIFSCGFFSDMRVL